MGVLCVEMKPVQKTHLNPKTASRGDEDMNGIGRTVCVIRNYVNNIYIQMLF